MRVTKKSAVELECISSDEENTVIKTETPSYGFLPHSVDNYTITLNAVPSGSGVRDLLACRVCLVTDVQLYSLYDCKLDDCFGDFTGTAVSPQDGLPQHLCCLCQALLLKSVAFRDKCRNTQFALQEMVVWSSLTTEYVRTIDKTNFKHPLTTTPPLTLDYVTDPPTTTAHVYSDFTATENTEFVDVKKIAEEIVPKLRSRRGIKKETVDPSKNVYFEVPIIGSNIKTNDAKEFDAKTIKKENDTNDSHNESSVDGLDSQNDKEKTVSSKEKSVKKTKKPKKSNKKKQSNFQLKTKKDYETFASKYNVDIVYLNKEEELQELTAKVNSKEYKNCKYKCDSCYIVFKTAMTYKKHMEQHGLSKGPYQCDICKCYYNTKDRVRDHIRRSHIYKNSTIRFKCRVCDMKLKKPFFAVQHLKLHDQPQLECKYCKKVFNSRKECTLHVRNNHQPALCDECGKSFTGPTSLSRHRARCHPAHKCPTCKAGFQNKDALAKHDCSLSSCATCGEGFASEELLEKHKFDAHTAKCEECGYMCSNEDVMNLHWANEHQGLKRPGAEDEGLKRNEAEDTVVCEICAKVMGKKQIHMHRKTHTREKPHQCKFCPKQFRMRWHLREHECTHTGEKLYRCPSCPATFRTFQQKTQHKAKVHMNKKYQCGFCKACFIKESNLKNHELKHSQSTLYKCDFCWKKFVLLSTCEEHMKKHHSEDSPSVHAKPRSKVKKKSIHRCKLCPQMFNTLWKFVQHKAEVHEITNYECDTCGKAFEYRSAFLSHLRVHTDDRPHHCSQCPKTFRQVEQLREHMNIHTGAKPYKCALCPETFSSYAKCFQHKKRIHTLKNYQCETCGKACLFKSSYLKHLRTHTDDRPHQCSSCSKSFRHPDQLREHMNVHTGEKPYKCTLCPEAFNTYSKRFQHKMRDHLNQPRRRNRPKQTHE